MWGQIKDYLGDYRFKFRKRNSNYSLLCKFEFLTTKYPILNGGASGALEERSIRGAEHTFYTYRKPCRKQQG